MYEIVIHLTDIPAWKPFQKRKRFILHHVNYPEHSEIIFAPHYKVIDGSKNVVAVFKVTNKFSHRDIGNMIINEVLKKYAV